MRYDTLCIVGVGLIGASVGLAVKRLGLARTVLGVGRQQKSLDEALTLGAIDACTLSLPEAAGRADFILFCTSVELIPQQIAQAAPFCKPGTLLSDVGSTKATLVAEVLRSLPAQVNFVGGHPIAGSEQRGPTAGRADLFENKVVVLTPTEKTSPAALQQLTDFWTQLGASVSSMSPAEHDDALARTSHLPHLLASALASLLPEQIAHLVGTGFRDTTRIASGDPDLWVSIFAQNRPAVLQALSELQGRLASVSEALQTANREALHDFLAQAKRNRDALGS